MIALRFWCDTIMSNFKKQRIFVNNKKTNLIFNEDDNEIINKFYLKKIKKGNVLLLEYKYNTLCYCIINVGFTSINEIRVCLENSDLFKNSVCPSLHIKGTSIKSIRSDELFFLLNEFAFSDLFITENKLSSFVFTRKTFNHCLQSLNLVNVDLSEIGDLVTCLVGSNVKQLDLSCNAITSLNAFVDKLHLTHVNWLILFDNYISETSDFVDYLRTNKTFKNLESGLITLDLRENLVQNENELQNLISICDMFTSDFVLKVGDDNNYKQYDGLLI